MDPRNAKGIRLRLAPPTRTSERATNMVRHHDQDERETDGAGHCDGVLPVLKGKFRNQLEKEFTDEDWLHRLYLGSIKTRFEICKDENGELRFFRAIQVTQVE